MTLQREQLFRYFFLGVFVFLIYQLLNILSPFFTGILGAVVFTLIFYPLHRFVSRKVGEQRANLSAGLSTFVVVVLTVIPFLFFSWILFRELTHIYPVMQEVGRTLESWREGELTTDIAWLNYLEQKLQGVLVLTQINLQSLLTETADHLFSIAQVFGRNIPKILFIFVINVLIMVFTMFFLFRDGPHLLLKGKELLPMDEKHKDNIARQLYVTVTAVVRGLFTVAVAQGFLAGVGFYVTGVPSPAFLGLCTAIMALIPFLGATSVWLPVAVYCLLTGSLFKAAFLFVWGTLAVSLVDNFLRALLIGGEAKIPVLFLFFGLLGGVKVYGPLGLFLGPLIVALLIAFIKIYREEYNAQIPKK